MGQILDAMCYQPQHSKGRLLYEFAIAGNVEAVKALCRMEGCAALEWTDVEGKTPLIAACTSYQGIEVAKALIKLGANVNAQSSGGTPLHYAAREGLTEMVELLLAHGATASVRNYDGQTPLDVAEMQGFTNVVHILESQGDAELAMAISSSIESAQVNENSVAATNPETAAEAVESEMAVMASIVHDGTQNPVPATTGGDEELAMALSYSIESAEEAELRKALDASIESELEARSSGWRFGRPRNRVAAIPSAPPVPEEAPSTSSCSSASCIICYEAPIEGVCSPCGHMAACMDCLAKIEAEKRECPVCRARIDKVIKVFGVG